MIITSIINQHLPSEFFARMQGRVLAVHCNDLKKTWYCAFEEQLYLIDSVPSHIDVTISSTAAGFVRYALMQDRTALHITGSIAVAETLQQLLGSLDIDWEEELSKHTGDVAAHQAMRFMQNLRTIELDQMVAEYLQEEAKLLPTQVEIKEYLHAVDQMRNDVDRLEARIKQYAHDR